MTNQRPADSLTNETTNQTMTQNHQQQTERFEEPITLTPNPSELASAITGDHVVVFGRGFEGYQFEVSGWTDADAVSPAWETIELTSAQAETVLEGGTFYTTLQDEDDVDYHVAINGGERHPKGTPVHTEADRDD